MPIRRCLFTALNNRWLFRRLSLSSTASASSTADATNSPSKSSRVRDRSPFPEAPLPETCCGSGCYNCVWIQYADAVHKYFDEHPEIERTPRKWKKIHDLLAQNVPDVNLRAYLEMEMKAKFFH